MENFKTNYKTELTYERARTALAETLATKGIADVRVLEAGHYGFASSARNAGFCCLPATKLSTTQLIKKFGMEETKKFFSSQIEGVDLLASIISENNIECEKSRGWQP